MDKQTKHREKSIELRSEKVRNIVGQIPSLLIRQGILIIGLVLLILIGITAIIPYQKTIEIVLNFKTLPATKTIKAPTNGIVLIDSLPAQVTTNNTIAYLQYNNKLLQIKSPISGKIISNTHNQTAVTKGELLFVVMPKKRNIIYAESTIALADKERIKKGQQVVFISNNNTLKKGEIAAIYTLPLANNRIKIRVNLKKDTPDNLILTEQKGKIIIKETSVFRYIFFD